MSPPAVNECRLGLHNCHEKARCVDTYQSFKCICKNGYSGNGVECNGKNGVLIRLITLALDVVRKQSSCL